MVHGSQVDPVFGYTTEDTPLHTNPAHILVCGATHRPFVNADHTQKRMIANIGSCGFPRDHGALGSVGIFNSESFTFKILRYDLSHSLDVLRQTHTALDTMVLNVFQRRPKLAFVGEIWAPPQTF